MHVAGIQIDIKMISGFCHGVDEVLTLLGCYAVLIESLLPIIVAYQSRIVQTSACINISDLTRPSLCHSSHFAEPLCSVPVSLVIIKAYGVQLRDIVMYHL